MFIAYLKIKTALLSSYVTTKLFLRRQKVMKKFFSSPSTRFLVGVHNGT